MLNDRITLFMLIKRRNKSTDVSMRNIKELRDFETELEKYLILCFDDFLFHVIVFVRVELQLPYGPHTFIHLWNRKRVTLNM